MQAKARVKLDLTKPLWRSTGNVWSTVFISVSDMYGYVYIYIVVDLINAIYCSLSSCDPEKFEYDIVFIPINCPGWVHLLHAPLCPRRWNKLDQLMSLLVWEHPESGREDTSQMPAVGGKGDKFCMDSITFQEGSFNFSNTILTRSCKSCVS